MRIHRPSLLALLVLAGLLVWWYHFQGQNARVFHQIRIGMTQTQVKTLIGSPQVKIVDERGEEWHYSSLRFPDMSVYFDTNALVRAVGIK
jgi:outer membrane protein assembly factor BamE (lipoprotein component of BamABCDE complex)